MTPHWEFIRIYDCTLNRPNILDKYDVEVISEALKLVNTQARAIPCLQRIIIEVDKYNVPNSVIRGEMESQGWMIKAKLQKESRRSR